jgi:S-formylglutathione hydrolase FrmB
MRVSWIDCHFHSEALGVETSMYVLLPQLGSNDEAAGGAAADRKWPTLFLLHGLSDDHTIWLRRTSIERYVARMGMAVVMPQVHRSFYADMVSGYKYWTFVSEELPRLARSFFPLSAAREDNFAAGLSMGGYGAFKLGLLQPERFAAVASLSGALNMAHATRRQEDLRLIFGNRSIAGTSDDLFYAAEQLAASDSPKPQLYQCCGTEDQLYPDNVLFREHCKKLGLELRYEEEPGAHNWAYWDKKIQNVLAWLPLRK